MRPLMNINNELIENMNKFGKSYYDAMKRLHEINMYVVGQFSEEQVALINLCMECAAKQMDMVGKQNELMGEMGARAQGIARNTMDILNETKDDVDTWVEKGLKNAGTVIPFTRQTT